VITFKGLLKFLKDYLFEDFEPTFLPPDLDMTQMKTFLVKKITYFSISFINTTHPALPCSVSVTLAMSWRSDGPVSLSWGANGQVIGIGARPPDVATRPGELIVFRATEAAPRQGFLSMSFTAT